jgi:uncharacterized membrane protein (UPF0127 family)
MAGLAPAHEPVTVSIGKHRFQVEVAESDREITRGLMYRERLGKFQGMLFVFPKLEVHSMWMPNMYFPLDIVWIDNEKKIVKIEENVSPCSGTHNCTSYSSLYPSKYAIELKAGDADIYGVEVGKNLFVI